ncbi:Shugoshin [Madurella mycetomatis]|uniref:Shugoshin n=1 Tax=Madurella mycetomatis TaxID=100816 RepID=A0A175VRY7_9PEZI|nr:Shugoshin [Madurella mycetomatis]
MARLNEPPASADSHFDILRRKFLRQNRDIAKINSDQSQKIRRLENDCAHLLSENLELRAQILRLEKKIEDNSAQRIADHALEIKAKLEAQLSEFGSLLGSLGLEPPSKRYSPDGRRIAKSRQSIARSPPQRKRHGTAADEEALAEQEGRLPPIYENKTYPRATMNSEEILALCAAAADTTDSPDLGPPPVSRFFEQEPVEHDSPARTATQDMSGSPRLSPPPKLDYERKPPGSPAPSQEAEETTVKETSPVKPATFATQQAVETVQQTIRAGVKRKFGDESETIQIDMAGIGKENVIGNGSEKSSGRWSQKRRSIKELPASKRERAGGVRMPLGVKSTNDDLSSPRKATKATTLEGGKKEQLRAKDGLMTGKTNAQKQLPKIEIPPPEPPAVLNVMLESEAAVPSAPLSSPATPDRPARQDVQHDTPPPADISSNGETSRPSRRARAAISYAEPNLRDKMRRPTKELFDAVTGEGKFVHRSGGPAKSDGQHPTSVSKTRSEPGSSAGRGSRTLAEGETAIKANSLSPLAQKDVFPGALPSTVVTERRKRPSTAGISSYESLPISDSVRSEPLPPPAITAHAPATVAPTSSSNNNRKYHRGDTAATEQQQAATTSAAEPAFVDIYDFANSSFASDVTATTVTDPPDTATKPTITTTHNYGGNVSSRSRTARKSSMAAAAALREMLDEEEQDDETKPHTHHKPRSSTSSSRKRASMLAPKKKAMLEAMMEGEPSQTEEGADGGGPG